MSKPRKGRRHYLHPRTATYPMLLERYLELAERSVILNQAGVTDEWKEYVERTLAKQRQS